MIVDQLLLRPVEVAQVLGLSRPKVYQMIAAGELPSIRIGSSVRVSRRQLEVWVAEREREADTEQADSVH